MKGFQLNNIHNLNYILLGIYLLLISYIVFILPHMRLDILSVFNNLGVKLLSLALIIYISLTNPVLAILLSLALVLTLQELNRHTPHTRQISEETSETSEEENYFQKVPGEERRVPGEERRVPGEELISEMEEESLLRTLTNSLTGTTGQSIPQQAITQQAIPQQAITQQAIPQQAITQRQQARRTPSRNAQACLTGNFSLDSTSNASEYYKKQDLIKHGNLPSHPDLRNMDKNHQFTQVQTFETQFGTQGLHNPIGFDSTSSFLDNTAAY